MRNLLEVVKSRTQELSTKKSSKFNTSDFMLEVLLDKEIKREDMIDLIIERRLELMGINSENITEDQIEMIPKLYKTSKNGLDTSVSDSQNNSSFSFNPKYQDYKLIKENGMLRIEKRSKSKK